MNKLNEYDLMKIFEYLDGTALKSCIQVCRRWHDMIRYSSLTMRKLPLAVDKDKMDKVKQITRLRRNFHTLTMDSVRLTSNLMTPLKKHTDNLRVLEFLQIDCTEASWNTLLKSLKVVEKITLVESNLSCIKRSNKGDKINIPTLKSLTAINTDWKYLESIGETGMEELKLQHTHFSPIFAFELRPFLKLQNYIVTMGIRAPSSIFYEKLTSDDASKYNFHLKKLTLSYRKWNDSSNDPILINFLDQHKESLEELEVECKLSEKIYEYIFTNLNIKSLMLCATHLPRESPIFYNSIRQNVHLKKLILTGELNSHIAAQGLFNIYRNVVDLTIQNWSSDFGNDILISIINNLKNISHLKIPFLVENTTEQPIPTLKHLSIESVNLKSDFQLFLVNQKNLESLSVKWIHDDINEAIETVSINLKNLKCAVFGPGFKPLNALKALKQNCSSLHTLQFFYDFYEPVSKEVLNEVNGNGLQIYQYQCEAASKIFSFEKGLWHDEDKFFIQLSSNLISNSDPESMDEDDDEDDYDSMDDDSDDFGFGYYDSNSDQSFYDSDGDAMGFEDYIMQEVIGFLLH